MRQKRDGILASKNAEKVAQRVRDEDKEQIGNALMRSATERKST